MRLHRVKIGGMEVLACVPEDLARKVRTVRDLFRRGQQHIAARDGGPRSCESPLAGNSTPEVQEIRRRVNELEWYHTIDLGYGIITPGHFDHRPHLSQYPIPERLDGMRVLDVGTYDGFWAFEFERRGAAEVVAIDVDNFDSLDLPPRARFKLSPAELARNTGDRFKLCQDVLRSRVRREVLSVYELSPERLGKFDFIFMGDLLLHLMNPLKALQNVCSVTKGHAVIVDMFHPALPGKLISYESGDTNCIFWTMSFGALEQMVKDAGFSKVQVINKYPFGYHGERPYFWHATFRVTP